MNAALTLFPFLQPYRWRVLLVLVSVLAVTAAGLLVPWLVREFVQVLRLAEGDVGAARRGVFTLAALLLAAYGVRSLAQYLTFHHSHVVAFNVCHDLRRALYERLQRFSPAYYAERQTGEVVSRVVKDTDNLEPVIADAVYDFLVSALLAMGIVVIFSLEPTLTLLAFLPLPVVLAAVFILRRPVAKAFGDESDDVGEVSALVQDNVSGIRDIQIYTREGFELGRVAGLSERLAKRQIRSRQLVAGMFPLIEGATGFSTVLVVLVGGLRALNGSLAIEDLVAFVLYLASFYQPLWAVADVSEALERGVASLGRIREVLASEPDVADPEDGGVALERAKGELRLERVSFAYGDKDVLKDISLHVPAGETLALVGPTGAGKSTLAGLLARFYDPRAGRITLDGHDLRDLSLDGLRRNLSVVQQDVFLFYASVAENIRFAKPGASDDEVVAAAKVANAHGFITELPQGYDTLVGERGVKLSGGQKQRLSIARAVLKDAPVLILDEATSAVDTETEAQIQASLADLMRGRTSVVIAHRLSTIKNADQIAVLDEGRVMELGRHEEIARRGGLYARLLSRQAA